MSIMRRLIGVVAKRKQKLIEQVLNHPITMMEEKLEHILTRHQDTVIGKKLCFGDIASPDEYRNRVPLMDSKSMARYLKMVYENPTGQILTADPVVWYLQTSGTTGLPKQLPITDHGLKQVAKGSMLGWMGFLAQDPENSKLVDGPLVTFGAPAMIDEINGVPVGYATGVYAKHQNKIFQRLIKPGQEVFDIQDMDEKMWEYAKVIATHDVTALQGITTLNLALIRRLQEHYGPALLDEFKGTKYEAKIRDALYDDRLDVAELCPDMRLFLASGIDTDPYRTWIEQTFPNVTIWEFYGASEGFMAHQLLSGNGMQLATNLNYFEFIPESQVGIPNPEVIPLSEVKMNGRYEIVVTNDQGFYRYRIGDMVTFSSTDPYTITSVSRKGRVINLSGEKLTEAHVSNAMKTACMKTDTEVTDFTVVGVVRDGLPYYVIAALFSSEVDPVDFVRSFEDYLKSVNMEFKIVRETGALGATRIYRMQSSVFEDRIKEHHVQIKPVPLTTDDRVLATCEAM